MSARWQHCDECKVAICLGIGCNADAITDERAFEMLVRIGWRVAPRVLCVNCRPEGRFALFHHPESDCIFWGTQADIERNLGDGLTHQVGCQTSYTNDERTAARFWRESTKVIEGDFGIDPMEYFRKAYRREP